MSLSPAESAHVRVLRLAPGAAVELFDAHGRTAEAVIDDIGASVDCRVLVCHEHRESDVQVHLVLALPKGNKLDGILRSVTELGAASIHLAVAERSVSRPNQDRATSKLQRWNRIIQESCRQCERVSRPELFGPTPLLEACSHAPSSAERWAFVARGAPPPPVGTMISGDVWLAIGPEGGLSGPEQATLGEEGWRAITFGAHILRVETAAATAVTLAIDRLSSRYRRDQGLNPQGADLEGR